jgi:hypothetical protein
MKYSKRIVAYIDILGFKNHIDKTIYPSGRDNIIAIDDLNLTYKKMKRVFKPEHAKFMKHHPEYFQMIDIKNSLNHFVPIN